MANPPLPAGPLRRIGLHTVEQEGDLLVARFSGSFTLAEAQEFTAHVDAITSAQGPVYTLLDMRQAAGPQTQAREWLGQWGKHAQLLGSAIFGANPLLRLVLTLMNNATRLLFRRTMPMTLCSSEAEARAWVTARRKSV